MILTKYNCSYIIKTTGNDIKDCKEVVKMAWTNEQLKCIEPKNGIHNMLVSAGAGAGKTATLVEKIIRNITNEAHNVSIDEVLCVTFTRDAAREMKERITAALELMAKRNPKDIWFRKQIALTEMSSIMTIDSFCLRMVKDHITETGIDPAFKIPQQASLSVLWDKTMEKYLEMQYEKSTPEFIAFVDAYASGKSDQAVKDSIRSVYDMAQSNPFPKKWLASCRNSLSSTNIEHSAWMEFLKRDIHMQIASLIESVSGALKTAKEDDGPFMYIEMLELDMEQLKRLDRTNTYAELSAGFASLSFARMSAKKDKRVSEAKRELVLAMRNAEKKAITDIQKKWMLKGTELKETIEKTRPYMLTLLDLTDGMMDAYEAEKRERNFMDFADIEHAALNLLYKEDGTYSELSDMVAKSFKQIYVDEYQDVNMLQETIIKSICGERFGRPNLFLVGDVKQSIYKFRLARPELFLEKYERFSPDDDAKDQKIELHENFRSRKEVLETVNFFFAQLMTPALGNICYDDKTALKAGAVFPLGPDAKKTELHLLETGNLKNELTSRQQEAMAVSDIIKSIVGKEPVFDRQRNAYRTATYKDIVVLTRTFAGWAEDICDILDKEGIPNYPDKAEGFFDTVEVQAVLSTLQAADNPMQDIPLTAAMMQVWEVTPEEMCDIAHTAKQDADVPNGIYASCRNYQENGSDEALKKKLSSFFRFLEKLNTECRDYSLYDVLNIIYSETGYLAKVSALPTGEVKRANLEMLLCEAEEFSKSGDCANGIFQFVQYVNALKTYAKEYGEASRTDKDATRVTTIHKSKGLEFPIVILAGIGKSFNQQDTRKAILVHQEMGVVSDLMDIEKRTKTASLSRRAVARKIQVETLEEELRILYVAMTRAKERLILVGAGNNILGKMGKYADLSGLKDVALPYLKLTQANSFLDWILMALARNSVYEPFLSLQGLEADVQNPVYKLNANLEIKMVDTDALLLNHVGAAGKASIKEEDVLKSFENTAVKMDSNIIYHDVALSKLKPKAAPEDLLAVKEKAPAKAVKAEESEKAPMPAFLKKTQEEISPADRGTVYHKILQMVDFKKCDNYLGFSSEVSRLLFEGILTDREISCVDLKTVYNVFESELGKRMVKAAATLKRETYYMEAVPATLVDADIKDDTTVIMQGVIDAYFKEDGNVILVDYKSDNIKAGFEHIAAKKHSSQMMRYRNVLEKNGQKVKESYVFFLQTGVAVAC